PRNYGCLSDTTDKPLHKYCLQRQIERAGTLKLLKRIREFDADVAICTHFLPTALLDRERRKGRCKARIVTVVTDFEVHGMWLATPSDHYFVATAEAKAHLEALGIAPTAVTASGIPTHPLFAEAKDKLELRRKHRWREDLPAILMSAGGFGAVPAARMVEVLAASGLRAQIIAVCGRNAEFKRSIEEIAARRAGEQLPVLTAVGFTTQMDELMAAADLIIGKTEKIKTSGSLIKKVGWMMVDAIPKQKKKNAIYLLENGAGVWSDNLHTLSFKVRSILENPKRLAAMQKNALAIARPDAGAMIAKYVMEVVN